LAGTRARGLLLLEHLQRVPGAPEAGWRPTTEAEAFASLGRREQFERLVGVVDLLGAGARPEGQARDDANRLPFYLASYVPSLLSCGWERSKAV